MRYLAKIILAIGVVGAVVAAWLLRHGNVEAPTQQSDQMEAQQPESKIPSGATPSQTRIASKRAVVSDKPGVYDRASLERYQCAVGSAPECETNLLKASSIDEAAWLLRNGFPTLESVEEVDSRTANIGQLKRLAAEGDLVAMGLYGRSLVNDGELQQAANVLSLAMAKGSVFAVHEMSRVYGSPDYYARNVHESAAYVRAAYLLGDSEAGKRLYIAYPRFGALEFAMADKRGYEVYMGIIKMRRQNGVAGSDPRPE
jgi:hypothetical protein